LAQRHVGTVAAVIAILALGCWALAATAYVVFRDEALKYLADRQIALARAHDREVGGLLAEIERLRSIKLLDQQRVERTLADLIRRQVLIEQRQTALQALAPARAPIPDTDTTGSLPPPTPKAPPKPSPLSDIAPQDIDGRLGALSEILVRAEIAQTRTLDTLERRLGSRLANMRAALGELGVAAPPPSAASRFGNALGGPFLPFFRSDDPFERQLARVRLAKHEHEAMGETLAAVPLRKPMRTDAEVTSGYGMRVDPFLRQLAMHTGIDLRGEFGEAVRAAAAGKVTHASLHGGYGLMVEIDHGNGFATRYAHLSAVEVEEGASVAAGKIVGRIGTSGRTTGPHLHYEVRHNGEPIDPQRLLRVGARLGDF
jgi:hypothetical protein